MKQNGSGDEESEESDDDDDAGDGIPLSVAPGTQTKVSGKSDFTNRPCSFAS